jgi:hypothetical protein
MKDEDPDGQETPRFTDFLGIFLCCALLLGVAWYAQWDYVHPDDLVMTNNAHLGSSGVQFQSHLLFQLTRFPLMAGMLYGLFGMLKRLFLSQ